jgi:hypothetical protein
LTCKIKNAENKRKLIFDKEGLKLLALLLKQLRFEKKITQEELAYDSELKLC